MKSFIFGFAFLLLLSTNALYGQLQFLPLSHDYTVLYEKEIHNSNHHTAVKPFFQKQIINLADSINRSFINNLYDDGYTEDISWLNKKLYREHFFHVQGEDYDLTINPLVNLTLGKDNIKEGILFNNTRGIQMQGALGKGFKFYTDFFENQSRFTEFIDDRINVRIVVPGSVKPKKFKTDSYDYFYANGFISYTTGSEIFNFQFGRGKLFIGDGYRSMLLSDNAYSYPYLKISTTFWKVQYVNIFTQMQDINQLDVDNLFTQKYTSIHHLSINLGSKLNIGLFEATTFQDSLKTRGYDIDFLNPIIFFRAVESNAGNFDIANSMIGASAKYMFSKKGHLYTQFFLDEFNINKLREEDGWWGNKYGFQLGVKLFDLFKENFTVQIEYNIVKPYTYSHFNSLQNYAHFNAALAHPLESNFREFGVLLHYIKGRWGINSKSFYHTKGLDPIDNGVEQNYGGDIYKSYTTRINETGVFTGQGLKEKVLYNHTNFYYLFNPNYNLRLNLGFIYRKDNNQINDTAILQFGVSTDLSNTYTDI